MRALDVALLRILRTRGHWPPLERGVLLFTRTGEHGALWLAICVAGRLSTGRREYTRAGAAVLLAYAVNTLIKYSIRRTRPLLEDLPPLSPTLSTLSYPSAHAATSFAAARALKDLPHAGAVRAAAFAMALSRPYIGVHYPSDVIAGAALGTAVAELAAP